MPRDRPNPWDQTPHDDEPTETSPLEDEPTAPPSGRRAARQGSRVNLDETNVGGSLLPDDLDAFSNPFAAASQPAFSEPEPASPRANPPVAFGPPPEPEPPIEPEPSLEVTEPRYAPTPLPNELADDFDDDHGLGPVEEFTISGLMPEELDRMRKAAVQASRPPEAVRRPRRDDPDPGITGVAGFSPLGPAADEEETVAARFSPEVLKQLGRPAKPSSPPPSAPRQRSTDRERPLRSDDRHYNTFGAGLQRLDDLPSVDEAPPEKEHSVGGILELLDQGGDLDLPGSSEPEKEAPPAAEAPRDRPRRVRTRRAGSRSSAPDVDRSEAPSRGTSPAPARQRTATPGGVARRPEGPRGRPPLQKSDARKGGRPRPSSPPLPIDTAPPTSRAADEEARIRAALAAVGDDEQTSWVKVDGDPAVSPLPRATTPAPTDRKAGGRSLPGKPPAPSPPPRSPEPSLTMHLEQVPGSDGPPAAGIANEETTVRRVVPSLGDEETLPTSDARAPIADEETRPVPVPSGKPSAPPSPPPAAAPTADVPTERPPSAPPKRASKKPPSARPPKKAPGSGQTTGARKKGGKKPPVEIGALGDDKSDTYRDPTIAWLLSILTVFFLGAMLIVFLGLLLYLI